jgi:hypothetical protein
MSWKQPFKYEFDVYILELSGLPMDFPLELAVSLKKGAFVSSTSHRQASSGAVCWDETLSASTLICLDRTQMIVERKLCWFQIRDRLSSRLVGLVEIDVAQFCTFASSSPFLQYRVIQPDALIMAPHAAAEASYDTSHWVLSLQVTARLQNTTSAPFADELYPAIMRDQPVVPRHDSSLCSPVASPTGRAPPFAAPFMHEWGGSGTPKVINVDLELARSKGLRSSMQGPLHSQRSGYHTEDLSPTTPNFPATPFNRQGGGLATVPSTAGDDGGEDTNEATANSRGAITSESDEVRLLGLLGHLMRRGGRIPVLQNRVAYGGMTMIVKSIQGRKRVGALLNLKYPFPFPNQLEMHWRTIHQDQRT